MKIIVQKFGGTSVANEESRLAVKNKIQQAIHNGYSPVVVVSAMGRKGAPYATDTLIDVLKEEKVPAAFFLVGNYIEENPELEILNGRYGPYIAMAGKNYKIPTGTDPSTLDLAACMEIIEKAAEKPASPRRRKSK